jgi:hypothetical protein
MFIPHMAEQRSNAVADQPAGGPHSGIPKARKAGVYQRPTGVAALLTARGITVILAIIIVLLLAWYLAF